MVYETREDLAANIGWEGGLSGFLEYGFRLEDVPENDTELREATLKLLEVYSKFSEASEVFLSLLPDGEDLF